MITEQFCCPSCGYTQKTKIPGLVISYEEAGIFLDGKFAHMSRTELEFFEQVVGVYPRPVQGWAIREQLWDAKGEDMSAKLVDVYAHKIRRRLLDGEIPLSLEGVGRYTMHSGFKIVDKRKKEEAA